MQLHAETLRREGKRIAVVPTMGALHEGHLSLIRIAKQHADVVITTIFVNPTQFEPNEDYQNYPREAERDSALAKSSGSDILFLPNTQEMYPVDYKTYVIVDELTHVLEGEFRSSHFRGVTTIVAKLFHITKPHLAVFGQKDAQQVVVITRMVRDLHFDIEIIVAPTVREPNGLALSSRNIFLSENERRDARVISRSLHDAQALIQSGERDTKKIIQGIHETMNEVTTVTPDYVSIVDPQSLRPLDTLRSGRKALIAIAARVGKTRLIDNILIEV